jgi:mRNA interferase RelE/StbE
VYQVEFDPEAEQDLIGLDQSVAERILKKLKWLAENFESVKPEPLHQRLRGKYKLRMGNYRAVYTVDRKTKRIRVHMMGHRDQIYETGSVCIDD